MVNLKSQNTMYFFIALLIFFFKIELSLGKFKETQIFSLVLDLILSNKLKPFGYHWHHSISGCGIACPVGQYCRCPVTPCAAICVPGCSALYPCPVGESCDLATNTCIGKTFEQIINEWNK